MKTEKISLRIDAELRRRLEEFSSRGIYKGEELQVVIRMLIKAGMELEETLVRLRAEAIQEMANRDRGGAARRSEKASPRQRA